MTDPETLLDRYAWHDAGLCAQSDPTLWFPESGHAREAKRLCHGCPVREACLEQAMSAETGLSFTQRHGIWGGLNPRQRAALAKFRSKTINAA